MNISTFVVGHAAAIFPHGDIDHETLPALRAASDALPPDVRTVTWAMDQVPFMDTTALHLLHEQRTTARHRGWTLFVRGLRPQHHRLLTVAASVSPTMDFLSLNRCR
ncbi:STAS domain-containing protein [Streptomyces parvulus]|uniref:STAS domain-containing protein n=1 Tax=Streptomyces parvulus TaxID=146923 RepID=UPI00369D02CF